MISLSNRCSSTFSLTTVTNTVTGAEERLWARCELDCGSFSRLSPASSACVGWVRFGDLADASGKQHDREITQLFAFQPASVLAKEAWNE